MKRNAVSRTQIGKLLLVVLTISSLLFALTYLILSFNNRFVSDDIALMNHFKESGWWGAITEFEYSRRYTSHGLFHGLMCFTSDLKSSHAQLFVFHVMVFIGFISGIYRVLNKLFPVEFLFSVSKFERVILSVTLLIALFFGSMQLNEVWFWTISSVIHLLPLMFLLHCLASIFTSNKQGWIHALIALLCGFYIGGASEVFAMVSLLLLTILGLGQYYGVHKRKNVRLIKIGSAVIGNAGMLLWNVLGNKMNSRFEALSKRRDAASQSWSEDFFGAFIETRFIIFILILVLMIFYGRRLKMSAVYLNIWTKKRLSIAILFLISTWLLTFLPLIATFGDLGPRRAWTPFGFTLIVLLLLIAIDIGNRFHLSTKRTIIGIILSGSLCILGLSAIIWRQTPRIVQYSKKHDQRLKYFEQLESKGNTDIVTVPKLPDAGMLTSCDIESDTTAWINQQYRQALNLSFSIRTREN